MGPSVLSQVHHGLDHSSLIQETINIVYRKMEAQRSLFRDPNSVRKAKALLEMVSNSVEKFQPEARKQRSPGDEIYINQSTVISQGHEAREGQNECPEINGEHSLQRIIKDKSACVKNNKHRISKLLIGYIQIKMHIVYLCMFTLYTHRFFRKFGCLKTFRKFQ